MSPKFKKDPGRRDRKVRIITGMLLLALIGTGKLQGGWALAATVFAIVQFMQVYFSF